LLLGLCQVQEEKKEETKKGEDEAERLQGEELHLLQLVRMKLLENILLDVDVL